MRSNQVGVSVVLPCLNEESSVALCVHEALDALEAGNLRGEIIVVDNGSTDDSIPTAEAAGGRIIKESRPGYGSALLAGFDVAKYEIVVMADADFTYDLGRVPDLVNPIVKNALTSSWALALMQRIDKPCRTSIGLSALLS